MTRTTTTGGAPKRRQPSAHAKQVVRDAFDPDMLAHLCSTWDFTPYATRVDLPSGLGRRGQSGHERFYWYKDNGSPILAVAHLDTVQEDRSCQVTQTAGGLLATSGALDDRLGVYVILELLPKLGITCDWLLTTDEEIGQSTAAEFHTDKPYNWIIEFDRCGTDVVMYQYETPELVQLVEASSARVGEGIFSDICELQHLGVAAFNWGVGYQDYHGVRSHAWLEDTFRMVARFVKFHRANADQRLEHKPWWDDEADEPLYAVADCGDEIDLNDPTTFVRNNGFTVCTTWCANGA